MAFEQNYFNQTKYQNKQPLIKKHALAVLSWASKSLPEDLLDGRGKRALDVGCAYGYASKVLGALGYETVGTDISAWGIKQAKNQTGSEFLVCDAETGMPFKAGEFDLVTCFDVLEHLPNPERALESMLETCKGTLVCTTPNMKVEKCVRSLTRDYDTTHINVKSATEWQRLLRANFACKTLCVEEFYDLPVRLGGKLFFKSFHIPTYGLTVRIAIKK